VATAQDWRRRDIGWKGVPGGGALDGEVKAKPVLACILRRSGYKMPYALVVVR